MNYIDGTIIKKLEPAKLNYLSDVSGNIQSQINDIIQNGSGEKIFFYNDNQLLETKSQLTLFTITTNKTVTLPDVSLLNQKKITILNSANSVGNLLIETTNNQSISYSGSLPITLLPTQNIILLSNGTSWYATQYSNSSNNSSSNIENVYTYTTNQTLLTEQQIAIFTLLNNSTVTLPNASLCSNKKITIINTYNSLAKLTISGENINNNNYSPILLPSQTIVFSSNGSNWFSISNLTQVYSILKASRDIESVKSDISNNTGLSINDLISFNDYNFYLIGNDIIKKSNTSFTLIKGKIYEITFNSINYQSNHYAIFELINTDTGLAITNNYNNVNNSNNNSSTNIFYVDLTIEENINISIRVKTTNALTGKLILGNQFNDNYIVPNITIKNITANNLNITSALDSYSLSMIKVVSTNQLSLITNDYITFDNQVISINNEITRNNNNKYFNLKFGKVYEINFFSALNNVSTDYSIFGLFNTANNNQIGESTYANYGVTGGNYNYILDLRSNNTDISIGIKVVSTNANPLLLGCALDANSNQILPSITIRNITGGVLPVTSILDNNVLSMVKVKNSIAKTYQLNSYIEFDTQLLNMNFDISRNINNKYFTLNFGKVYEINFFSSILTNSDLYITYNLFNINTNTVIGETSYINYGTNSGTYEYILDLRNNTTNITIGIKITYIYPTSYTDITLGNSYNDNLVLPTLSIKNITGLNVPYTITSIDANLGNLKLSGNIYPMDNNNNSLATISQTELSYLDGITSNIQTQLNSKQGNLINNYNNSQTISTFEQTALFTCNTSSIATLPNPSSLSGKRIYIKNNSSSTDNLNINSVIPPINLTPGNSTIVISDGTNWNTFNLSSNNNNNNYIINFSYHKSIKSYNSYLSDISNNTGLSISGTLLNSFITFDSNSFNYGLYITKNANNKFFTLTKGKIYEIIFNIGSIYLTDKYGIFNLCDSLGNEIGDSRILCSGLNSYEINYIVDLSTAVNDLNIGIKLIHTDLSNNLILGSASNSSDYVGPSIIIKIISDSAYQNIATVSTLNTNNIWTGSNTFNGVITFNGNIYVIDNNTNNIITLTPTELSYLDNLNSNIQSQFNNTIKLSNTTNNISSNNIFSGNNDFTNSNLIANTQINSDNSTKVATTAYINNLLNSYNISNTWQKFNIAFKGTISDPSIIFINNGISNQNCLYYINGKNLFIKYDFWSISSSINSNGSGIYLFNIPGNVTINSNLTTFAANSTQTNATSSDSVAFVNLIGQGQYGYSSKTHTIRAHIATLSNINYVVFELISTNSTTQVNKFASDNFGGFLNNPQCVYNVECCIPLQ